METPSSTPRPVRFVPRITLSLLGGLVIFVVVSLLYCLPVLIEPLPPGAIEDYRAERVRERMEGKALYFLTGSVMFAALASGWRRRA